MKWKGGCKILQIMPADGWFAEFSLEDRKREFSRIVCFALVESVDGGRPVQEVRPIDADSDGFMDFSDGADNFAALIHQSELPKEWRARSKS